MQMIIKFGTAKSNLDYKPHQIRSLDARFYNLLNKVQKLVFDIIILIISFSFKNI